MADKQNYRMFYSEAARCLLCEDDSCRYACPERINVGRILRALNFRNVDGARRSLDRPDACMACTAPCQDACRRNKIDEPVAIRKVLEKLASIPKTAEPDISLETHFCGKKLINPFLLSSSVVSSNYDMVARAFDMGWGGVCFKTIGLFIPEEISPRFGGLEKEDSPMIGFKNAEQISDHTLQENLSFLKRLKAEYPDRLLIASIMGQNEEEWEYLAKLMEQNGADIVELNFSCPQMTGEGLGSDVGTDPGLVSRYTAAARRGTHLKILAKMTPNITDMTIPARAAIAAGADGLAAINTVKSIMNIDLDSFISDPAVSGKSCVSGYSGKAVKPIALRFLTDLAKDPVLSGCELSGMGGIENWKDACEFLAVGCGTVQVTTAVMQYGYRIIEDMIEGTRDYLAKAGFDSIEDLKGKALSSIVPADDLDRSTIEYPRFLGRRCIGCGRCIISCEDGGHQALRMSEKTSRPVMDPGKCVGCQLCRLVCPAGAIEAGTRISKEKVRSRNAWAS